MRLVLEMALDNADFFSQEGLEDTSPFRDAFPIAKILRDLARNMAGDSRVEVGMRYRLSDSNGNTVGFAEVKE